jgi:hypothetical protein
MPGLLKAPAPLVVKLTVPVGALLVPLPVSVTVAVQVVELFTETGLGVQETVVVVVRGAAVLNVTVKAGFAPSVAVQGFVVPVQVEELRLFGALHPANVEAPFGLAENVAVGSSPPGALNVIFEAHVLDTVCVVWSVPEPPQVVGAFTV